MALMFVPVACTVLRASYSTSFPEHISQLMPVYLNPAMNKEWNSRMSSQTLLHSAEHGELVHQTYNLPWPLKTRELLMHCENKILPREHIMTAMCHSAEADVRPITSENVRMEILESRWRFEALPGNGRMQTRITVQILINDRFAVGVPSFVVKYVQDQALKDSVHQFVRACRKLNLPPHNDFVSWRRTRQQARAATLAAATAGATQGDEAIPDDEWGWACVSALLLSIAVAAVLRRPHIMSDMRLRFRRWRHPRAVRRLERALAQTAVDLQPRVPTTGSGFGAITRSCSLTHIPSEVRGADACSDTAALLLAGNVDAMRLVSQRRSLSASNIANVVTFA